MAIIGNDSDALLHGLSDFWLRYFKDIGDLKALYEGTEILIGQAYLNFLSDVLNASVVETPLFKKQYYHLLVIPQDQLEQTDAGWVYTDPTTTYGKVPFLQNKVYAATAALEDGFDYSVDGNKITFTQNPFQPQPLPGFAYRVVSGVGQIAFWAVDAEVDEYDLYYRFGHYFSPKTRSSETYRTFIRGIMQLYLLGPAIERIESALNVVAGLPVVREDGEVIQSINEGVSLTGTDGQLYSDRFQSGTYFGPTAVGGYVTITNSDSWNINTYPVIAVSADGYELQVDAPIDYSGPWAGFHAATGAGWAFSATGKYTIVTDKNTYVLPQQIARRSDIAVGLSLSAFEPLTDAVQVTDYISDPEWWYRITIPENLLEAPLENRVCSPDPVVGKIGATAETGYAKVGDLGFTVGPADGVHWNDVLQSYIDDALGTPTTPLPRYRQRASFVILDTFLKLHLFGVTIDQRLGLSTDEMRQLLNDVKPTHTAFYFKTGLRFTDTTLVDDSADLGYLSAVVSLFEEVAAVGATWLIGQGKVGGGYAFEGNFTPALIYPVTPGATNLVVGGANPAAPAGAQSLLDLLQVSLRDVAVANDTIAVLGNIYGSGAPAGLYVVTSSDRGVTWTISDMLAPAPVAPWGIDWTGQGWVIGWTRGGHSHIATSVDGRHFTEQTTTLNDNLAAGDVSNLYTIAASPSGHVVAWAVKQNSSNTTGRVSYSTDYGATWAAGTIANDFSPERMVWAGGNTFIGCGVGAGLGNTGHAFAITTDGGATWTTKQAPTDDMTMSDFLGIAATPTGAICIVDGYGIWRTADQGNTWTRVFGDDSTEMEFDEIVWTPQGLLAIGWAGEGFYRSTDDGHTFQPWVPTGSGSEGALYPIGSGSSAVLSDGSVVVMNGPLYLGSPGGGTDFTAASPFPNAVYGAYTAVNRSRYA